MWTIDYADDLDRSRPSELLTADAQYSITLQYRYLDSGDTVTVPNVWKNQNASLRAAALRARALVLDKSAIALREDPPAGMQQAEAAAAAERVQGEAQRLRDLASVLESPSAVPA